MSLHIPWFSCYKLSICIRFSRNWQNNLSLSHLWIYFYIFIYRYVYIYICFYTLTLYTYRYVFKLDFPGSSAGKNPPTMQQLQETWVQFLDGEDPLEEGTATLSSILAWRIPWTEEPGVTRSTGSQRVRHNWINLAWLGMCLD